MPRPGVHPYWVDYIRTLIAEQPAISAVEIRRKIANRQLLKDEPKAPTNPPSERSIRRIKKDFEELPRAAKQLYEVFSWPESMESGALPWEASRAGLELLRYRYEAGLEGRPAPQVREVRQLWKIMQAIPDAPVKKQIFIATSFFSFTEMQRLGGYVPSDSAKASAWFQFVLAYQPWRSQKDKAAWLKLPDERRKPPFFLFPLTEEGIIK